MSGPAAKKARVEIKSATCTGPVNIAVIKYCESDHPAPDPALPAAHHLTWKMQVRASFAIHGPPALEIMMARGGVENHDVAG